MALIKRFFQTLYGLVAVFFLSLKNRYIALLHSMTGREVPPLQHVETPKSTPKKAVRIFFCLMAMLLLSLGYVVLGRPSLVLQPLDASRFKEKQLEICSCSFDGWKVRYYKSAVWKKGAPTLLFVHGFRSSSNFWLAYLQSFPDYNIVMVDLPGHGETSYKANFIHDLRGYGRFVEQFCEHLDLDSLYVVGTSMGGGTALSFAGLSQRKILAVAVTNPLAVMPPKLSIVHEELFKGNNLLLPSSRKGIVKMQEVLFGKSLGLSWFRSELLYWALLEDRDRYLKQFQEMQDGGGVEDLLERIDAPVLLIQGDRDLVVDPSCVDLETLFIPRCEVVWVDEGPHVFLGIQQRFVAEKIADFFGQQSKEVVLPALPTLTEPK